MIVVGQGYVGLPLAMRAVEKGYSVVGYDVDEPRIKALAAGESFVEDVTGDELAVALATGRYQPTTDAEACADFDLAVITVPTPLREGNPDLSYIEDAARTLAPHLRAGATVVLESTTYPGTTRERLVPLLEESGLKAGRDFNVAFSPERVDPGRTDFTLRTTPKVVGGLTDACLERACDLYREVCDELVPVTTPEAAELSKLLENVFRSVNIALVNELAMLCDRMKIDIWEVVEAAATKPYGFMKFSPGPGMGGHCLPVDPFYLAWKAREHDTPTEFIELAGEVNQRMPYFCVEKIMDALNDHAKPVRGSKIAIVGVSYKSGVGDMRESPALKILRLLDDRGAQLVYHDDYVPELPDFDLRNEGLDTALDGADCAVIVTAHPELDVQQLVNRAPLVVDFRGVTRGIKAEHLVRL